MFIQRPALRVVLLFAAGILLAGVMYIALPFAFGISLAAALVTLYLSWKMPSSYAFLIFSHFLVLALGCTLSAFQKDYSRQKRMEPRYENEHALVFGTVRSEPLLDGRRIQFVFECDSMVRSRLIKNTENLIVVFADKKDIPSYAHDIQYGRPLVLNAVIDPFPTARNLGEFDYGRYLELNDISGVVHAESVKVISQNRPYACSESVYALQKYLYHVLDGLHSKAHSGFLKGIVLGYRADIAADVKQSFMNTGTIHILAVSGENVAFVILVLYSLFQVLRIPRIACVLASTLGLLLYMLVTGSCASVVRATIMALVLLFGTTFERKSDIYNSLSISALILLIWNTGTLYDVGFQLSFAAVFSIVFFYPRIMQMASIIPATIQRIWFINAGVKLFAVSLAAQLGTLPFTTYYFGKISIVSLFANIIVVPLSGLNTILGFVEILVTPLNFQIALCYAAVNDLLLSFLLWFVACAANLPFAYINVAVPGITSIAFFYIAVIGMFYLRKKTIKYVFMVMLVAGNIILYRAIVSRAEPSMRVNVMDVGQGDAIIINNPDGQTLLIDSGPSHRTWNAGERTIVPYLQRQGIAAITYAILTHPHDDHIGGIQSIAESVKIDTIIVPSMEKYPKSFQRILDSLQTKGSIIKKASKGVQLSVGKNERAYILHPKYPPTSERNLNNVSLVLKLCYGQRSFLFVGDAENKAEDFMMRCYGKILRSDVLKIGHHGSISGTTSQFLSCVRPAIALISVGKNNKFGHPSAIVLGRLRNRRIEVLRTDLDHEEIIDCNGAVCKIVRWQE